jgi:ergothioneine biosynthesis protein EgtB
MPAAQARLELGQQYRAVRRHTMALTRPLGIEDQAIQSMPDASPTKWHLAHTTWFFETFILAASNPQHRWFEEGFQVLFNSYYNGIGEQHQRARRGMLSRPELARVHKYREWVDERLLDLVENCDQEVLARISPLLILGINHEQQHQELLITDIKHSLYQNPLQPAYRACEAQAASPITRNWQPHEGGRLAIGHSGDDFCFDNELPQHEVLLQPFEIADTVVSNGEWLEFMADGAYTDPLLWLSEGWAWCQAEAVASPLYWSLQEDGWMQYRLCGPGPVDPHQPVCHISYYEADAYSRWAGFRLPTEAEWETSAETRGFQTQAHVDLSQDPGGEFSCTWEWTASAYLPYPGFRAAPGAVGEYNGKFMINQMVLRGASAATAAGHSRPTYRNFFPPQARWQYTGLRLARDPGA